MFHRFANPTRFLRFAAVIQPWIAAITVALIGSGLYLGLFNSPADYQQGETVRIMYVHVPAAWMALFCYSALAGACAVALIWKRPLAELAAKATAPIGASFTFLALVTPVAMSRALEPLGDVAGTAAGVLGLVTLTGASLLAAVVGFGGFLGMGERQVSLPMDQISFQRDGEGTVRAYIAQDSEQIEDMPEYKPAE